MFNRKEIQRLREDNQSLQTQLNGLRNKVYEKEISYIKANLDKFVKVNKAFCSGLNLDDKTYINNTIRGLYLKVKGNEVKDPTIVKKMWCLVNGYKTKEKELKDIKVGK